MQIQEVKYVIVSEDEKAIVVGRNQYRKLTLFENLRATNFAVFKRYTDALAIIMNQRIEHSQGIKLKVKGITRSLLFPFSNIVN